MVTVNQYHKYFVRRGNLCRTRVHINAGCVAKVAISSMIDPSMPISDTAPTCIGYRYYLNSNLVAVTDS